MDLQEVHKILDFFLRKAQSGFLSPEEKDRVLNRAQVEVFDQYKSGYAINQQYQDALLPFKKEQSFTNESSPLGLITLNQDYVHLLAVETVVSDSDGIHYIPVEQVGEDEVSQRKSSALIPLNVYNPIGLLKAATTNGGPKRFQLYPAQASAGTVYYLRKPQDVQFVYTQSGRTITYDPNNSKQLEWNEPATEKIIMKALSFCGINTQDVTAIQLGQAKSEVN
jgi:hypothetical protein